jgi:hypothetical protein
VSATWLADRVAISRSGTYQASATDRVTTYLYGTYRVSVTRSKGRVATYRSGTCRIVAWPTVGLRPIEVGRVEVAWSVGLRPIEVGRVKVTWPVGCDLSKWDLSNRGMANSRVVTYRSGACRSGMTSMQGCDLSKYDVSKWHDQYAGLRPVEVGLMFVSANK